MMIAKHCGYEPGVFTHFVANEQIYDRHVDAANEMLKRGGSGEIRRNIGLKLNTDKTNFYDFTVDDFEMVNYEPQKPQLKLELGI